MANALPSLDSMRQRRDMVRRQVAARGLHDPVLLTAMGEVPREAFVPVGMQEFAYDDSPLPLQQGQTISQPYIVARMIDAAALTPDDSVLEVGTGSGYAAAVMSRIADRVYSIERHAELAETAARRLQDLGYDNVEVRHGDGTEGWPEAAPFDAILVAAAGAAVPDALRRQLAVGGRLVMPVGDVDIQSLRLVMRTGEDSFEERPLGAVRFVPLIAGGEAVAAGDAAPRAPADPVALIRAAAEPLPGFDDPAFGALFDRFADARVVLLGEASHGTSEFYRARAAITRRLVARHGFTIVAAEADWPDAAVIDRHVRQRPPRDGGQRAFERFPTWMWRNTEFAAFVDWLHDHNEALPSAQRAGFHGLDLYSLGASMRAVINYLDDVDPDAAKVARARYGCLTPWQHDPAAYGRMAVGEGYRRCEQPVVAMLRDLLERRLDYAQGEEPEARFFDAAQNAHLVADAERYYRSIYRGAHESWNLRDTHMFETLERLLKTGGPKSRAVVWAHNSHIGNAAYTEMGQVRDELNIGQLCRQRFGDQAMLIGFGTHAGTVAAADDWDEPMQVKAINPSMPGSYERLAHDSGVPRFLLDLRDGRHDPLRRALAPPRAERFIGVVYRPDTERLSHYAQASLPGQFDAYVWFDTTTAVTPTPARTRGGGDDTWPTGL